MITAIIPPLYNLEITGIVDVKRSYHTLAVVRELLLINVMS
jgi:hypothetical protein